MKLVMSKLDAENTVSKQVEEEDGLCSTYQPPVPNAQTHKRQREHAGRSLEREERNAWRCELVGEEF